MQQLADLVVIVSTKVIERWPVSPALYHQSSSLRFLPPVYQMSSNTMSQLKNIPIVISGGIWQSPHVSEQPTILLLRWRIFEVEGGSRQGERHLIGYNLDDCEGRVSTAIVSFDQTKGQCITQSGRVYTLIGPPGYDPDGEYVWCLWATANLVFGTIDVSSEYASIVAASSDLALWDSGSEV